MSAVPSLRSGAALQARAASLMSLVRTTETDLYTSNVMFVFAVLRGGLMVFSVALAPSWWVRCGPAVVHLEPAVRTLAVPRKCHGCMRVHLTSVQTSPVKVSTTASGLAIRNHDISWWFTGSRSIVALDLLANCFTRCCDLGRAQRLVKKHPTTDLHSVATYAKAKPLRRCHEAASSHQS